MSSLPRMMGAIVEQMFKDMEHQVPPGFTFKSLQSHFDLHRYEQTFLLIYADKSGLTYNIQHKMDPTVFLQTSHHPPKNPHPTPYPIYDNNAKPVMGQGYSGVDSYPNPNYTPEPEPEGTVHSNDSVWDAVVAAARGSKCA